MTEEQSRELARKTEMYQKIFVGTVHLGEQRHYEDGTQLRVPDVEVYLSDTMPMIISFLKYNILSISEFTQTRVTFTVTYNSEVFGCYGGRKVSKSTFSITSIHEVMERLVAYLYIWNEAKPINGFPKGGA